MNKEYAIIKIRQMLESQKKKPKRYKSKITEKQWSELISDLLDHKMWPIELSEKYGISTQAISYYLKTHKPYAHQQYKSKMSRDLRKNRDKPEGETDETS